jgi:hypothetical protein
MTGEQAATLYGWRGVCIVDRCPRRAEPSGLCAAHGGTERTLRPASKSEYDAVLLAYWPEQDRARHEQRLARAVR